MPGSERRQVRDRLVTPGSDATGGTVGEPPGGAPRPVFMARPTHGHVELGKPLENGASPADERLPCTDSSQVEREAIGEPCLSRADQAVARHDWMTAPNGKALLTRLRCRRADGGSRIRVGNATSINAPPKGGWRISPRSLGHAAAVIAKRFAVVSNNHRHRGCLCCWEKP